ncbi:MAG: HEAT repeat domain-containing protein [Planctomycetota bacterium]|jgi:HEAT repeat protein
MGRLPVRRWISLLLLLQPIMAWETGALEGRSLDEWLRGLSDVSPSNRLEAATTLGELKKPTKAVVDALVETLVDDDRRVREAATASLVRLGAVDAAWPYLERMLDNEREEVRCAAYRALATAGDDAADLFAGLIQDSPRRVEVMRTLSEAGGPGRAVLGALLVDHSWHVRMWTLRHAGLHDSEWIAAVAAMASGDGSTAVRHAAVDALARWHPQLTAIPRLLARAYESGEERLRLRILRRAGSAEDPMVGLLLSAVIDTKPALRAHAALWLRRASKTSEPVLDALRALLRDEEAVVRTSAAAALGHLDVWTEISISLLVAALRRGEVKKPYSVDRPNLRAAGGSTGPLRPDPDPLARAALFRWGSPAVPHIEALLEGAAAERRIQLARALGQVGLPASDALNQLLKDEDPAVRREAALCLAATEGARGLALDTLLELLLGSKSSPYYQESLPVEPVVREMGPPSVLPLLRLYATEWKRGQTKAVPGIRVTEARDFVIRMLRRIGDPAKEELGKALDDPELARFAREILLLGW